VKVIIAGSRTIGQIGPRKWDYETLIAIIDRAVADSGLEVTEVISGGAPGPDRAAAMWARSRGIPLTELRPDWRMGRGAGMAGNTELVRAGEALVALYDGVGRGTADTIQKMRQKGGLVHVETVNWEQGHGEG
jgi:hypothetical protein